MTHRPGNHWGVTIVRASDQLADGSGRRDDDELVAVVVNGDTGIARRVCDLLNADDERARFQVEGYARDDTQLLVTCDRCLTTVIVSDGPLDLADVNRRAAEHAEVCR